MSEGEVNRLDRRLAELQTLVATMRVEHADTHARVTQQVADLARDVSEVKSDVKSVSSAVFSKVDAETCDARHAAAEDARRFAVTDKASRANMIWVAVGVLIAAVAAAPAWIALFR